MHARYWGYHHNKRSETYNVQVELMIISYVGSGWRQIYFPASHAYLWFVFGTVLMMFGRSCCKYTRCLPPVYLYFYNTTSKTDLYHSYLLYSLTHTSQMCGDKVYYTILHMTPINKMSLTQSYYRRKWERRVVEYDPASSRILALSFCSATPFYM